MKNILIKALTPMAQRADRTEAEMAAWTPEEHFNTLRLMRQWKRGHLCFGIVFFVIAYSAFKLHMDQQSDQFVETLLFYMATVSGLFYIWTCYVYRIFELRQLIGLLHWFKRYPLDLFRVSR